MAHRFPVSVPCRPHPLAWLISLAFAAPAISWAQATPERTQVAALHEIVVSGSRSEQDKDEIPATVDVIGPDKLEEAQIQDIRDAVKDIPNVSVRRAPARFGLAAGDTGRDGNAGFNIRGLDGNRVLMLVDGIRQPRSYVFSANAFGRDYIDVGLLERIEIVKGPASALYGSDALGGLVNFITRSPSSYLGEGKTFGGSASISYSGDDNGKHGSVTLAGRPSDTVEWLLAGSIGRMHELENKGEVGGVGPNRTLPNPENDGTGSVLGKVVIRPNADQRHTLSFEHVQKDSEYNLLSGLSVPATAPTSVIGLKAKNELERDRFTWDGRWQLNALAADSLQAIAGYQRAKSREYAFEDRISAADRARDTTYDESTFQFTLQADKSIAAGGSGIAQRLLYGVDYANTQVENLQTGLTPPVGETFPLKRFPDTTEKTAAFFVQDEFIIGNLSITPGLRFDHFSIDADQQGFGAQAVSLSDSAVSPKLGLLYRVNPQWSLYGNYATGFKAPNAFQVNNFFENVLQGYKTIPNPDLKPEKSQNFEVGFRTRMANFNFDAAAFTGNYKDFIEDNTQVGGRGIPRVDPLIFQTVNIGEARISGFEFKGEALFPTAGSGVFSVPFSYGQTRGHDRSNGAPLNSVEPAKATLGLKYQAPVWSVRLDAVYHAAKKASDIDTSTLAGGYYAIPSATTLDLGAQWRIRKDLRLNAAIVNLTDKKYWQWSDVRGGAVTASNIDAFSQAGRYFNVSMVVDF